VPALAAFDRAVAELMAAWGVPGAQLAVAKDGRLVLDRGYGFGDVEAGEPVQPGSRFRIASVSKALTAVAVLTLVDAGKLALEDRAFPLLALEPPANATVDPRLAAVTVGDLLVHAGGWDSAASGDPQSLPWSRTAAATVGAPDPPDGPAIVRFMLGWGLDFDPGAKSVYSNFGFNVLGRVIEQVAGEGYEDYVAARVLAPAGVADMRLAGTRLAERAPGEVRYYPPPAYPTVPSVFPGEGFVAMPYGNYYLTGMDAHGGWIARTADLVRFATAVDGQRGAALLRPATVDRMLHAARPPAEGLNGAANDRPATGLGWVVQPGPGGLTWAHTGALGGGTGAYLARIESGVAIAFVGNTLPADFVGYLAAVTGTLPAVAAGIEAWPDHDLFAAGA
jgi:N-acyl-D-amino-acid deacylase